MTKLEIMGAKAKEASYVLANITTKEKDDALLKMAQNLIKNTNFIISENKKDLEKAKEKGSF